MHVACLCLSARSSIRHVAEQKQYCKRKRAHLLSFSLSLSHFSQPIFRRYPSRAFRKGKKKIREERATRASTEEESVVSANSEAFRVG